jgi:hypothetical protein
MPTDAFVTAVRELDRNLLTAMRQRIDDIERDGPPDGVHIDMKRLPAEHRDRATWLENALTHPPETDWDAIRTGARELLGD